MMQLKFYNCHDSEIVGIANSRVAEVNSLNMGKLPGHLFVSFFEVNCTPSGKKMVYNFKHILTHPSMHRSHADYGSLGGEATQCSWQTRCGYMLNIDFTQDATVYT